MVFSAVLMVSSFEAANDTHDLVGVGEKNKTKTRRRKQTKQQLYVLLRHIDAVRSRRKAERGKLLAQLLYPNRKKKKKHGPVSCSEPVSPSGKVLGR